jgi:iron(III) transport system permease protein
VAPVSSPPGLPAPPRDTGDRLDRARLVLSGFQAGPLVLFWALIVAILVLPILLFLLVAFCPRLLGQGGQWFTLGGFTTALGGRTLQGAVNSLMVGVSTAVAATAIGGVVAWMVLRTNVPGRRLWSGSMFALLLAPSYLIALGWERLLEPSGVFDLLGIPAAGLRTMFYGPVGVIVVLTVKGLPFAYLALYGALRGLGEEFESAARVHGGGRLAAARVVAALLAPACWSALAIVFAESVSDFGVAATLANDAHFPVATYTLYNAINNFPVQFPVAAAVGWILMAMAGLALLAQNRAMRGRAYRVLGGRSRPARRHKLSVPAKAATAAGLLLLIVLCLGVPTFGAVSASLIDGLGSLAGSHSLTLANYTRVLHNADMIGPLLLSARLAALTATAAVLLGLTAARLMSTATSRLSGRLLDMLLLTTVALPGIVFAAGYIFTYNLPLMNTLGIHLYQTPFLLLLGYLATALPSTSRVLLGSVSQLQPSLREAGRVHGAGATASWLRTVLPLLTRPLISAWVLTFCATLLELPVSQLLYPPGQPPVSVGITKALSAYDYGGGTAMEMLAILFALIITAALWAAFRLLAPAGWQRLGRSL